MPYDAAHFRLDGGVALVTGAGAGIGRAIAETFASAGAAVAVTDRDASAAESVAAGIVEGGGRAFGAACDVTRESDLVASVDRAVSEFGSLTILINNAGGGGPKPFDMPMSDMRFAYELNLFSLFRLCQLAAPHMEKAGGEPANGILWVVQSCSEPSDAKHRFRPWTEKHSRQCDRTGCDTNPCTFHGPYARNREEDAVAHALEAVGGAVGHGQCGTLSVRAGLRLDQRPDPHGIGRWRPGTRLKNLRRIR